MAGLPPLKGSVVPRSGPHPPPGFFAFEAGGVDAAGDAEGHTMASVTLPPRAALFFRRSRAASAASAASGLAAGLRAVRDVHVGETLFEEDLLFVGPTTPHAVAASRASAAAGPATGATSQGPASGVLIPQLPASGRSAGASEFAKGAAALWRVLAAQHQERHRQQASTATEPAQVQFSNAFLDGGDGFGGGGGGGGLSDASATDYADLVASTARAYTVATAQCMQQLDEPGSSPWARRLGLELRHLCPEKEEAERHVRAAVMLHKLLTAVSAKATCSRTGKKGVCVTVTAEDIAVVHALASEHNLRTHELYPGGPAAFGSFVSTAVAVPFAAAANCKLTVAESSLSTEGAATLRVRCVACAAGGSADDEFDATALRSDVVAIREGDELRLLRAPLLTGDDARQAQRAHEGAGTQPPKPQQQQAPRLGETEAEAARRKMLAFIGSAKENPERMRRLMELQQQQQQ